MYEAARDEASPLQTFDTIVAAVENEGLASRGAFHVAADDAVPPFTDGAPAATLVLVGNMGPRDVGRVLRVGGSRRRRAGRPGPMEPTCGLASRG